MVLVGLRDPAESSMDRSEVVRMMQEMEWAAYFDFVVGARAIAGTEGGVPECVVNGIPASLGLNAKVRLLMTLAAALAQHGDDAAAQTVLWAALNDAAMAGQAEVLRTAVGAGPVFAAAGGPDLLVRLHEELVKESNMSVFDQRGQHVTYQYNAAGDINFGSVDNRSGLAAELRKLERELAAAQSAGALAEEPAADAQYNMKKAALEAAKPDADKHKLVDYLGVVKSTVAGVNAMGGLVGAVTKAIEVAQKLF